jgi:hypothetical protein
VFRDRDRGRLLAVMRTPRSATSPTAWTWRRTPSGAWRFKHLFTGSVVFSGKNANEAEIERRLADTEATIARLQRQRTGR